MIKILKDGHQYDVQTEQGISIHALQFQDGTVPDVGRNGLQNEEVIEVLIDRMNWLNKQFPCRENAVAITKLDEALLWLNKRTADRIKRGVEGKHVK